MIKSMTGYGSYQISDEMCSQNWEIRSVNHKQLSLRWKIPNYLRHQEMNWERNVRNFASRGRIEISLNLEFYDANFLPLEFNRYLAKVMLNQIQQLAQERGESFVPDYSLFLSMSGLWQDSSLPSRDKLEENLREGLDHALASWDQSRIEEGRSLKDDLLLRLEQLQNWYSRICDNSRELASAKFQQLQERVQSLLETFSDSGGDRMLQELALMSDRLDISEELTRLQTHLDTLRSLLQSDKAGGRKLDFLLQECFREINTCGNKAQDIVISQLVVDFKTELEKCREQVQNLE